MKKQILLSVAFLTCTFWVKAQVSLELDHQKNFASMVLSPQDYNDWIANDGFSKQGGSADISKKVYQKFKDDFDFVFFISNEQTVPSHFNYYGKFAGVSNSNLGIGISTFSYASSFGSAGKLKGVMHIPYRWGLKNGPTLHEFMHSWGNYALKTGDYTTTGGTNNDYAAHWGFTGGSNPGQLGGFDQSTLTTNVNGDPKRYSVKEFGVNANGGNVVPYTQLELYLMGMIPASQVSNFDLFKDITSTAYVGDRIEFVAGTRETYNGASVETKLGVRQPGYLISQKDFKVLFVAVSGAPLTEAQRSEINDQVTWFAQKENDNTIFYNFFEATGGRGSINISNLNTSILLANNLTLTSQNNGKPSLIGLNNTITWQTDLTGTVSIDLYRNGVPVRNLSTSTAANAGTFSWSPLPEDIGSDYRIRISSTSNPALADYSDFTFDITNSRYKVSGLVTESNGTPLKNAQLQIGEALRKDQSQEGGSATIDLEQTPRYQSFKPTGTTIGKAELYLSKTVSALQDVYVDIADSNGVVLGRDTILNKEIIAGSYTTALFFPAVKVEPEKKYLLRATSSTNATGIKWYLATTTSSYARGRTDIWPNYDFLFKTYSGTGTEAKTDANGYYELQVSADWSGTIALPNSNTLYPVAPASRNISNLTAPLLNQNFTITSPLLISGKVLTSANTPVAEALVSWGAPVLTDQQQTQHNFSTYLLSNYAVGQTFTPTANKLSQLQFLLSKTQVVTEPVLVEIRKAGQLIASQTILPSAQTGFPYWATAPFIPSLSLVPGEEYTILLTSAIPNRYNWYASTTDTYARGIPVNTGTTNFDFCFITSYGEGGSGYTDAQGYYEFRLPLGWTGETMATRAGYTFYPLRYSAIATNTPNQDFKDGVRTALEKNTLAAHGIKVFPNPATDVLQIEETNAADPLVHVEIADAAGNTIRQLSVQPTGSYSFHVSDLPGGLYYIKLSSATRTTTTKLIKR